MFVTRNVSDIGACDCRRRDCVSRWMVRAVGIRRAQREGREKKRRAEKFEELIAAIYEFDHWLDNERTRGLGGNTSSPEVSPFAKIQAISAVHFPSFDPLIRELDNGVAKYRVWIETASFQRVAGKLTEFPAGYLEALKPYSDARDKLLDSLKKFAHTDFQ